MSPHTKQLVIQKTSTSYTTITCRLDVPPFATAYPKQLSKTGCVIALDLHGVVFSLSLRHIVKLLWQCPQKHKLLILCVNVRFWHSALKAVLQKQVIEQLINTLAQQHAVFAPFKPLALEIANAQKPNQAMVSLLNKLRARNYSLIAFSNIGAYSITTLAMRYPDIFNLFDHIIHTSAHDNYVAKPSPQAFDKLLGVVDIEKTPLIFIDDTAKNIKQARAMGLYAIPFFNVQILEQTLKHLKIV